MVDAAGCERKLGRATVSREQLEAAIIADPASFAAHRALAEAALAAADRDTARRELERCLLRRTDNPSLKRMLAKTRRSRPFTAGSRREPHRRPAEKATVTGPVRAILFGTAETLPHSPSGSRSG
jgi:predicted Zn-dependent protease